MNLGKTNTLPGCSEFHGQATAATGAATLTFSNTSLTPPIPGHAATARRGAAASGAATRIVSDTSNKLLSVFMLHVPFLIGPVRDRLCGAIGFPRCHLTGGRPDVSLVEASEWRIPDGPASRGPQEQSACPTAGVHCGGRVVAVNDRTRGRHGAHTMAGLLQQHRALTTARSPEGTGSTEAPRPDPLEPPRAEP